MQTAQAVFYLLGVILIAVAALLVNRPSPPPVGLALLGAASLALGYSLPVIAAGF